MDNIPSGTKLYFDRKDEAEEEFEKVCNKYDELDCSERLDFLIRILSDKEIAEALFEYY